MKKIQEAFLYFLSENAIMQKTFFLIIWKDFQIPPRDKKSKKAQHENRKNEDRILKKAKRKICFSLIKKQNCPILC